MELHNEINTLRTEIRQLWTDLGISFITQNQWKPMKRKSIHFDKHLLTLHKDKRNQLLHQWNDIANDLNDLLMDLDTDTDEDEKLGKTKWSEKENENNRDSINSQLSSEIEEDDIFSWTADGKSYRLLNDKERELVKKKAAEKHKKFAEEFKQFKQERKQQLAKELNNKDLPKVDIIRETRRGYAFLYSFIN